MDALDKSVKLADAVNRISKIPGLSKIASFFENKSEKIIEDVSKKVEEGLDMALNQNKKTDEKK